MSMARAVAIEISIVCDAWLAACPDAAALAGMAAREALAEWSGPLIVGIVLTDDTEQRELNRRWRGQDAPTNVLSFATADAAPPPGAPVLLGDVVLAFETVAREATEQAKPLADHLRHLVVHGVLHLIGFDHDSEAEAAVMEAREAAILTRLGVPDPYSDIM